MWIRWLVAVAWLAGPVFVVAARAAAEPLDARVLGWGDSLTAGGDWLGSLAGLGYPDWLGVDFGLAGESSWHAAQGCEPLFSPDGRFRDWLGTGYQPRSRDVFVLLWGTNDVAHVDWKGDGCSRAGNPS